MEAEFFKLYHQFYTDREIADMLAIPYYKVQAWRVGQGLRSNHPNHRKKMELYSKGCSDQKIADALGYTSAGTIYLWRRGHGLLANGKLPAS